MVGFSCNIVAHIKFLNAVRFLVQSIPEGDRAMSDDKYVNHSVDQILPDFGKLFYQQKSDFVFCKPHLMPLKSITLQKLENMQKEAHKQLQETRAKTAATEFN